MEKYRVNVNGKLFELNSNMPLSVEQQQAEILKYLQQQPRNIGLLTVPGTRTQSGRN